MNDRTTLALAEALREHDHDVSGGLPAQQVLARARRRRTRRHAVAGAGAAAATALVVGIALSMIPGSSSTTPPATRSTTPHPVSTTSAAVPSDPQAWLTTLPTAPLDPADDTLPQASMDGARMVLTLHGRSVRMPEGIRALTLPRAVDRGWVFVGVTQLRAGGVYENTRILQLDTRTMTVRELASAGAIYSLLVSPRGDQVVWVDLGSTEPGTKAGATLHLTRLSDGGDVLARSFDERKVGLPATWSDRTITFVRTRVTQNGGDAQDVDTPTTNFDIGTATWSPRASKRQVDNLWVVPTVGQTTAIVQLREVGGDRPCIYRMTSTELSSEPLACGAYAKVSPGGGYVALIDEDSPRPLGVIDTRTWSAVSLPEPLTRMASCDWEFESVLSCTPQPPKGSAPTVGVRWSVIEARGQRFDVPPLGMEEGADFVGRIFTGQ